MNRHCESCGKENPRTDDGYTTCCNQPVCYGDGEYEWTDGQNEVSACCVHVADEKFKANGINARNFWMK